MASAIDQFSIPVIDVGALAGNDHAAKVEVARALRRACETVGFFYIRSHGVAEDDLAQIFALGRAFFELPLAYKESLDKLKSPQHAGYTAMLAENTDPANKGDLHESFDMVSQFAAADGSDVNQWPDSPPQFKACLSRYLTQVYELGTRLFEAVALSLGLPGDFFHPYITRPTGILRLNHYPPQPPDGDGSQIGIGAHTDYECFTILAQQPGITALQVWNGREWIHAPPIPGTFIVNIGDQLQRWTNDVFLSTRHRAINATGSPRMSIPFFLGVNYETVIEPLPSCVSDQRPSRYPPVIAGEYILQRLNETYGVTPATKSSAAAG